MLQTGIFVRNPISIATRSQKAVDRREIGIRRDIDRKQRHALRYCAPRAHPFQRRDDRHALAATVSPLLTR